MGCWAAPRDNTALGLWHTNAYIVQCSITKVTLQPSLGVSSLDLGRVSNHVASFLSS